MFQKIHPQPALELELKQGITPKEIDGILQHIYKLSGCTNCGFLGFDIHLRVLPEEVTKQIGEIGHLPGVQGVNVR